MDMSMIMPMIQKVFQGSGGKLSKQAIISKVMEMKGGESSLPFFKQLPEKNDYTEQGITQEMQNIVQKQGGKSAVGKIREKVGI